MRRLLLLVALLALPECPGQAATPAPDIQALGAAIASRLAHDCPPARPDDVAAFQSCAKALGKGAKLPFATSILWGNDQPNVPIAKKSMTEFRGDTYQLLYMPLFSFTGVWKTATSGPEHAPVIEVQGYFRNALPPGEYPYPFWHSAAKWNAYETANLLRLYIDGSGRIVVVGRSAAGDEAARGPYAHVTPPAFDGRWQWTDADGKLEPQTSLFSNKYAANNPFLPKLDNAYRAFALSIRDGSCLSCHTPANKADATRLILLQTPLHSAGEVDDVIKQVKAGDMPQDDWGLKKDIDPTLRATILDNAETYRDLLAQADAWEKTAHP